jgi:hypothetical protein
MTKQVMFCQSLSFWNFFFRTIETLLIEGVVIFTESLIKINIFLHFTFDKDGYVKFYSTTRDFLPFFTGSHIFSASRIK